jgi:hypothetical protein
MNVVCVAVVYNEPEAGLAVSLLETEGISVTSRMTNTGAGLLGSSGAGGPIEILVEEQDEERARALLADVSGEDAG